MRSNYSINYSNDCRTIVDYPRKSEKVYIDCRLPENLRPSLSPQYDDLHQNVSEGDSTFRPFKWYLQIFISCKLVVNV